MILSISSLTVIAQRQFKLKEVESFFSIKKDSIIKVIEKNDYKLIKQDGETYIYQVIDSKINEYQVLISFKRNDLIAFGWTELSDYCKEVTTEMFESNYFYNGGDISNDKDLAISLVVKPSENRLYIVLKER